MSWNLSGILEKKGKGAYGGAQVAGHLLGQAVGIPFRAVRNFALGAYERNLKELSKIKNPHMYENVPFTGRSESNFFKQQARVGWDQTKGGLKSFAYGTVISGAMYGLGSYATDDPQKSHGDRMAHYSKYAVAGAIDVGSDLALTGVSIGLATFGGPAGAMVAGGLQMFNMFAGFAGMDAGSLAMSVMDYADQEYDKDKMGKKFNMTQNTSMAMQRQIQNMHGSGSNLGEMMHN